MEIEAGIKKNIYVLTKDSTKSWKLFVQNVFVSAVFVIVFIHGTQFIYINIKR